MVQYGLPPIQVMNICQLLVSTDWGPCTVDMVDFVLYSGMMIACFYVNPEGWILV
jgi:hypothetical protein